MTIAALTMAPAAPGGSVPPAPDQPATPFADVLAALGGVSRGDPLIAPSAHLPEAPTAVLAEFLKGDADRAPNQAPVERDDRSSPAPISSPVHFDTVDNSPATGLTLEPADDADTQESEPAAPLTSQAPHPAASPLTLDENPSCRARPGIQCSTREAPPPWIARQARTDEEEVRHIPTRAAVFNERGLLRDVVAKTSTPVAVTDTAAPALDTGEAATPPPPSCRARPGIHVSAPPPADARVRPWTPGQARGDEGTGAEIDHAVPLVSAMTSQSTLVPSTPPVSTARARQASSATPPARAATSAAPAIASSRAARSPAEPKDRPIARSPTLPARDPRPNDTAQAQLNLAPTADGLHVLAAVTRTDRDERTRLRDRIAGLLSRHGFALADLRLGGAALPPAKDR